MSELKTPIEVDQTQLQDIRYGSFGRVGVLTGLIIAVGIGIMGLFSPLFLDPFLRLYADLYRNCGFFCTEVTMAGWVVLLLLGVAYGFIASYVAWKFHRLSQKFRLKTVMYVVVIWFIASVLLSALNSVLGAGFTLPSSIRCAGVRNTNGDFFEPTSSCSFQRAHEGNENPSECFDLEPVLRGYCLDGLSVKISPEICATFKDSTKRDTCHAILDLGDTDTCAVIENIAIKVDCYRDLAKRTLDPNYCGLIDPGVGSIISVKDFCYDGIARKAPSVEICKKIQAVTVRNDCYLFNARKQRDETEDLSQCDQLLTQLEKPREDSGVIGQYHAACRNGG